MEYRYKIHYIGKLYTVYSMYKVIEIQGSKLVPKKSMLFFYGGEEAIWDYAFLLSQPQISISEKKKKNIYIGSFYIHQVAHIVMLPATPFNLSGLNYFFLN